VAPGLDLATIVAAFGDVLQPWSLLVILLGALVGIVVGVIPGLGSPMAIAILLPFTFALQAEVAMSMLVAIWIGSISGGCISAILVRIPGTPSSVATLLDGFPMAQEGRAGQALGNAVVASLIGTLISGIILVLLAPVLARFALKFFFAEYAAVTIFALTTVAAVSGRTLSRGLFMALLGLFCATVGVSEQDGLARFTFGYSPLMGGIGLIPALIGIFAMSQIMHEATRSDIGGARVAARLERVLPRLGDVTSNLVNYLRSGLIGTFVGVLPALGGGPAGLISYAQARNASREPDRFGRGAVEGVIAAETANNATIGGALIITLTLGIPGDPVMAILLGGLMIHGLEPGPQLFRNHPEVIYGIYFSVFAGIIAVAAILLLAMRPLARLVDVPRRVLLPVLFVLATLGVFALNNRLFDVQVMLAFGALGYVFDRLRYPLAPFVLGLVLGPLLESHVRRMLSFEGSLTPLVTRPIALTFMILSALSVAYYFYTTRKRAGSEQTDS